MSKFTLMTAAGGLAALLLAGQPIWAGDDTVRLGTNIQAKTSTLAYDGQSITELMRGVRGGVGRGGFGRGGFGYGRGGFGYGRVGFGYGRVGVGYGRGGFGYGYGGYGVGYGGYWGGYGGYYGGYGCYPYVYGAAYYSPYYAVAPYYAAPAVSYYPVSVSVQTTATPLYRPAAYGVQGQQQFQPDNVLPAPAQGGMYPYYDNNQVVPMPQNQGPLQVVPGDGRFVSLPATKTTSSGSRSGFAFSNGDDRQTPTSFAVDRFGMAVKK